VAEEFRVESSHHVGRADRVGRRSEVEEPVAHHVDEVMSIVLDTSARRERVVRGLLVWLHVMAGDTRRAESPLVVEGVEVAVPAIAGVAPLRGPHAIRDIEVASEDPDVAVSEEPGPAGRRSRTEEARAIEHDVLHPRAGEDLLHPRLPGALGCPRPAGPVPDATHRVLESGGHGGHPEARGDERSEGVGERAAEHLDRAGVDERA
jgi:hypothetical protein